MLCELKGAWLLDLGRLSLGIGFGLASFVGPVYLAEITPKNVRGLLMSISQSMTGYGASFTFLVGCIPSLLLLLALFFIPESPRWLASATGQCLACFLTGLSYFLQDLDSWKEASRILALIGVLVYMVSYAFGMVEIPWIVVSEGSAGTLCNMVNWLCSWVVSYTFNYSFSWSPAGTFFIYAGICGFGVVFIAKLVPETKGRTLEEIHASLTRIMQ
ncbi:hypothetical protein I3842_07G013600 [Carya illinoinensis]|uniref:Major facilitator superfamily (MFS) profile domain-containing protein n=1 Tax=Carya illinoinensis TaxID=32201 RepID=A0A922JDL1_CARIL|nr:hypothetical protein I3842_07G013600 [Carya illinoinensis]